MSSYRTIDVGIDIGTTSTKICARNGNNEILCEFKQNYSMPGTNGSRQDPIMIVNTAKQLIDKVIGLYDKVIRNIWICGQMHGIVLWNSEDIEHIHTDLYNWMYEENVISELPKWNIGVVYPGFGISTLAYLNKVGRNEMEKYNRCGTIMEYFSCYLTKTSGVSISRHNAHSWGYCSGYEWQSDILNHLPPSITLPLIVDLSTIIGSYHNINIHVSSGDLQSSVASLEHFDNTAYIILGTSAQLCCLYPIDTDIGDLPPTVVSLPYSKHQNLLAACAMNGGNAVENIMKMRWKDDYSSDKLADLLAQLDNDKPIINDNIRIEPIFIKERGTDKKLLIKIEDGSCDIQVLEAGHYGIILNLFQLFSFDLLSRLNINNLALVGTAKSARFRRNIELITDKRYHIIEAQSHISTPFGATKFY